MKFIATIKAGKLLPSPPESWPIAMREYEGKQVTVEIEPVRERRSDAANKRWFGVLLPLVRHVIDESRRDAGEPPMDWGPGDEWKDRLHDSLVVRHAGVIETAAGPIRKSTRIMSKREFYLLTESVVRWLAELGFFVPELGEQELAEVMR